METFLNKNFKYCPKCKAELDLKSNFASCSQCDFLYYQNPAPCTVLLFHKEGKVLLAKRAIEPMKGYWDVPGGFIDIGETAEKSALREAKEETNLDAKIIKYLGSYPDIYGDTLLPSLIFIYHVEAVNNDYTMMKAQDDVSELVWFDLNDLPQEFAFANVIPAIEMLKISLKNQK
ncbi:MAG: NUDIX domain-containing protein [Candidatus Pacebacteria bacterium]|nr:NUDIX domain-containing protein [Candidatus Paceibacterota bacterium]